jgi:hypothetical protein
LRFLFIALLTAGLIIGTQAISSEVQSPEIIHASELEQVDYNIHSDLVPHDPLLIDNNSDFVDLGCSGNGSISTPYILEGLEIKSTNDTPCLKVIWPVDVYYTIKNCSFSGTTLDDPFPFPWDNGSVDIRSGHGSIVDCEVYNSTIGIVGSFDGIVGNTVRNCSYVNIWVLDSDMVSENTLIRDGWYSMKFESGYTTIEKNRFMRGTDLSDSEQLYMNGNNITIQHNIVECSYIGFYTHGNNFYFYNNTFEIFNRVNNIGVTNNMSFVDCIFRNATDVISTRSITSGYNATLRGCTLINTNYVVQDVGISDYSEVTINNCLFEGSAGIRMYEIWTRVRIIYCTFSGKQLAYAGSPTTAISCTDGKGSLYISNNEIEGYYYGISVTSNNLMIVSCTLEKCIRAIYLQGSSPHVRLTEIVQCDQGIELWANYALIKDNKFQWNDAGIRASSYSGCHDNRIYYNQFISNVQQAEDNGLNNMWDDNVSMGNYWSDYDGSGPYEIWGSAGAEDRWPAYIEPIEEPTSTEGPSGDFPLIPIIIGVLGVLGVVVYVAFKPRR